MDIPLMHGTLHHNHDLNLRMIFQALLLSLVFTGTGSGNFTCDPDSHCKSGTCKEIGCASGCDDGYYGRYCKTKCNAGCKDKKCVDQGYCEGDCEEGKWGRKCTVDCWNRCSTCSKTNGSLCTTCKEFNYGSLCSESCREKCNKTGCDMQGECKKTCSDISSTDCVHSCGIGCKICNVNSAVCEGCHDAFRGQNCSVYCGDCIGKCTGLGCVDGCKPRYYGTECEYSCNAHCKGELCYQRTGNCLNGCSIGYYGPKCRIPCKNCKDDRCDSRSGECILGCKTGFYGIKCSRQCHHDCSGFCTRFKGTCFTPKTTPVTTTNEGIVNNLTLISISVGSCVGFLLVGTTVCLLVFRWRKYACFRERRARLTTNYDGIRMRTLPPLPRETRNTCEYSYIDDIYPSDDGGMVARGGHEAGYFLRNSVLLEQSVHEPHLSWFENNKVYRSRYNPVQLLDMRMSSLSGDFRNSASHSGSVRSMIDWWSLSRQHSSGRNKVCVYDVSGKYLLPVNDDTPNDTGV